MRLLAISSGTVAVLLVLVTLDVFAVVFGLSFLRARKAQRRTAAGPVPAAPGGPAPVARRDFLRRGLLVSLAAFTAQFGGATLAFLWPNLQGGFGSTIPAGTVHDLISQNQQSGPVYFGAARSWIGYYGDSYAGVDKGTQVDYSASGAVAQGLMALYQKCAHLGCRVPYCNSSQWFECPCHGSKYNRAGEYELGPAPNGLQRFPVTVDSSGNLLINTAAPIPGPPRGTDTINEPPQGAFCVAPG